MKIAVFLTATNRVEYFRRTVESWKNVRGLEEVDFFFRLEPTEALGDMYRICESLEHPRKKILINSTVLGVLHHPWVGFNDLFEDGYDFIIRAEDDLLVSSDILEYFQWAAETFETDSSVGAVLGFSQAYGDPDEVHYSLNFNPWVWGTWKDRWEKVFRDTWDHDYSTYNIFPGNEAGWDWNLNTRIFPSYGYGSIVPNQSRVQNIGEWGVHGTPHILVVSTSFQEERPKTSYYLSER